MLKYAAALPSEQRVRAMTDRDYLYCLLHMRLDYEESLRSLCPDCRQAAESPHCACCGEALPQAQAVNTSFDEARFAQLRKEFPS